MNPLPGTPPMSEREGWLLQVAELLERVAELEAEVARLREALDEAAALSVLDDPEVPR